MARNFVSRNKLVKLADHAAANTTAVTSSIVDTAGYQGVVFLTSLGTANATNTIKVQQNTANQTTGMADLEGTSVTSGASDEDLVVEVYQPLERYLQVVVTRGASTTCESIWAILYNGDAGLAATAISGTAAGERHSSPAEGTA
jgi:hypothetical protein